MTAEEAKTVASIMTNADSGCRYCAERLMAALARRFPEHKDLILEVYNRNFGETDPLTELTE